MINSIIECIKNNILMDEAAKLKFIQLSSTEGKVLDKSRIVLLFFKNDELQPFIVAKFTKLKKSSESIVEEYKITKIMYEQFSNYIPRPIGLFEIEDNKVFIQEFSKGKSISNKLYEVKSFQISNEEDFLREANRYLEIGNSIVRELNTKSEICDLEIFGDEVGAIIEKFSVNYNLNPYEKSKLSEGTTNLISLFSGNVIKKRITHLDFTPSNIIILDNNDPRIIDYEFSKESTLTIIEPLRFLYYIYRDMHELDISTYNKNIVYGFYLFTTDINHPLMINFNKFLKEEYNIEINRFSRKTLCMLLFIIEANLQFEVSEYVSKDFENSWKRYINYFTEAYGEDEIFEFDNSLVTELNCFLQYKDVQINQCEEAIEKIKSELILKSNVIIDMRREIGVLQSANESELILKSNKIIDMQREIDVFQNTNEKERLNKSYEELRLCKEEISKMKATKIWRFAEKVRKIRRK